MDTLLVGMLKWFIDTLINYTSIDTEQTIQLIYSLRLCKLLTTTPDNINLNKLIS